MDLILEVDTDHPVQGWANAPIPEIQGWARRLAVKSFDGGDVYLISFGVGVASGVVANWLYDQLAIRKAQNLRIDDKPVDLTADAIRRVVDELIIRAELPHSADRSDPKQGNRILNGCR